MSAEPIVPVFETMLLVSPFQVYPYPGHFLIPDANTAAKLGVRYNGLPLSVPDPRLNIGGMWHVVPNTAWWLQMEDGTGVECSELAGYWQRMGKDHPDVAEAYCIRYVEACRQLGQKIPTKPNPANG